MFCGASASRLISNYSHLLLSDAAAQSSRSANHERQMFALGKVNEGNERVIWSTAVTGWPEEAVLIWDENQRQDRRQKKVFVTVGETFSSATGKSCRAEQLKYSSSSSSSTFLSFSTLRTGEKPHHR